MRRSQTSNRREPVRTWCASPALLWGAPISPLEITLRRGASVGAMPHPLQGTVAELQRKAR